MLSHLKTDCETDRALHKANQQSQFYYAKVTGHNGHSYFYSLLQVDDKKFSVSINMYFGIVWNESRLDIRVSSVNVILP